MIGVAGWAAARKTQNCEAEAASKHTRKIPTFSRRFARQSHDPRRASRSLSAAKHATATGCDRYRGLGGATSSRRPQEQNWMWARAWGSWCVVEGSTAFARQLMSAAPLATLPLVNFSPSCPASSPAT